MYGFSIPKIESLAHIKIVGACAAAGKLPPPGWAAPDESVPTVSLSNVKRSGDSKSLLPTPYSF